MRDFEQRLILTESARAYYQGTSIEEACQELTDGLDGKSIRKVHQNTLMAVASNEMAEAMNGYVDIHPPYGLVRANKDRLWISADDPMTIYNTVTKNPHGTPLKETQDELFWVYFPDLVREYADYLGDTMLMYFHRAIQDQQKTMVDLAVWSQYANPMVLPRVGVNTQITQPQSLLSSFYRLWNLNHEGIPTVQQVYEYSIRSQGRLLDMSRYHKQRFQTTAGVLMDVGYCPYLVLNDKGHRLDFSSNMKVLDLAAKKNSPFLLDITTGCPARVSIFPGKPAPIIRGYHRLLALVCQSEDQDALRTI